MKKITIVTICVGSAFGLITLIGSLLFGLDVIKFEEGHAGAIFIALVCSLFIVTFFLALICYYTRGLNKKKKTELQKAIESDRMLQLLALYKRFGIEPRLDKNGKLLNFYELLGIEPQFDEFGERIPTIYELLNILPKFDSNGNEVPTFLFIKNRIQNVAKLLPSYLTNLRYLDKENVDQKPKDKVAGIAPAKIVDAGKKTAAKKKEEKKKKSDPSQMVTLAPKDKKGKKSKQPDFFDILSDMFNYFGADNKPRKIDYDAARRQTSEPPVQVENTRPQNEPPQPAAVRSIRPNSWEINSARTPRGFFVTEGQNIAGGGSENVTDGRENGLL